MVMAKEQIYIIDDDESVCRSLKCLLLTFGFDVGTFSSGLAFFSAVSVTTPGCLILDIHMPELNGWEVLKGAAVSGAVRPVIMMTADKGDGLKEQALKAGAVGFLQKPFEEKELLDVLGLAFKKKEARL